MRTDAVWKCRVRPLFLRPYLVGGQTTDDQPFDTGAKNAATRMTACISRALLLSAEDIGGDRDGQSVAAGGEWYKLNISKERTSCDNDSFYGSR